MQDSNLKELLLWLIRLRRRFGVTGASMFPLLRPGDEVLVNPRAYRREPPRPGDLVAAQHPDRSDVQIVKRVVGVEVGDQEVGDQEVGDQEVGDQEVGDQEVAGHFHLQGDNPDPTQSDDVFVPRALILGRVTSKFG
ncbi:MAG: S26 family signal peptidase [Chloroflexi bacterium]|nr:S26 family signal peptidase [Chloroflexota bacterium]